MSFMLARRCASAWPPTDRPAGGGRILTRSTFCGLFQRKVERVGSGGDGPARTGRPRKPPSSPSPRPRPRNRKPAAEAGRHVLAPAAPGYAIA
jgi:hypothetical protein